MSTDATRRRLYEAYERLLGAELADVMMEHLPPVPWTDVARQANVDAQFVAVRGEMAELRAEVRGLVPKLITANIASGIGIAGLVLAAARLG